MAVELSLGERNGSLLFSAQPSRAEVKLSEAFLFHDVLFNYFTK